MTGTLFDEGLRIATAGEIDALAVVILLVTQDEAYENDEYFQTLPGAGPAFLHHDLIVRTALIHLLRDEQLVNSENATLLNVLRVLSDMNKMNAALENLAHWNSCPDDEKQVFNEELRERLTKICCVPPLSTHLPNR